MRNKRIWALLAAAMAVVVAAAVLVFSDALADSRDLRLAPPPDGSARTEAAWLYVIGINDYMYVQKLRTCVSDAKAVRDVLIQHYQFSSSRLVERYDKEATRERILTDLYDFAAKLGPDDSLFIYYAGHGYEDKVLNEGYWVPVDGKAGVLPTYVSNADIQTRLAGIRARHIWLVSDSCFSGSLLASRSIPDVITDRYYREKYKLASRQVMTSGGSEPVADSSKAYDCREHSVFACYFIKSLANNEKQYMTPTELFPEVAHIVSINSNQTPVLGDLRQAGHEGGEFVLIARMPAVPEPVHEPPPQVSTPPEKPAEAASPPVKTEPAPQPPAAPASPPSSGKSMLGVWKGDFTQFDTREKYVVVMKLEGFNQGQPSGKIEYPTFKCGGNLVYQGEENGRRIFTEEITKGKDNCVSGGRVELYFGPKGDLRMEWKYPDGKLNGAAPLTKVER